MRKNVSNVDALVRGLLAALLAVVGVSGQAGGVLSFVAILAALWLMATALTRECPIYRAFHIGTARTPNPTPPIRRG